MNTDQSYMRLALECAEEARGLGEVPVGAVIVKDGVVVGRGLNRRETCRNSLAHAEIEAIDQACRTVGGWRLSGCTLYVTLEPCPMCTGALINSRIDRIVYGAPDAKAGSCGTLVNLVDVPYNHAPEITGGILEDECGAILTDFFKAMRNTRGKRKWNAETHQYETRE